MPSVQQVGYTRYSVHLFRCLTTVMKLSILLGLLAYACNLPTWAESKRPNVILILADDLGWGDLGCYGQKQIHTPNLDRMAGEGMRFTHFYAGSTVCGPSRCCLLTGRHTGHATIRGNGDISLSEGDTTVGTLLKRGGYHTAVIGKWGLGEVGNSGVPSRQGFDDFFGYLNHHHAHNYYPEFLFRGEEKVRLANEVTPSAKARESRYGTGVAHVRKDYSHDLFAAEALQWIRGRKDHPFFLYLCFTMPHANNEAGEKGMEVPDFGQYAGKDWPDPDKGRAAMISRMDADIGRLLTLLKETELDDRTALFFTSDNGPHREGGSDPEFHDSNGPLRGVKRDLWDGGIRVPLLARWPGKISPGQTSAHLSANWDLLPTLCELAGVDSPAGLDGISFSQTLLGKGRQHEHEALYWEFYERGPMQAIRTSAWKGIYSKKQDKFELYAAGDTSEEEDVSAQHPEIVAQLLQRMTESRTACATPQWNP